MYTKEVYYQLLVGNKGRLNELALGEQLGLDETQTRQILAQLLAEFKIRYEEEGACAYSINTPARHKRNRHKST